MDLAQQIEALLFYKGEPLKKAELCSIFDVLPEVLALSLHTLASDLSVRGIRLLETESEVTLVTAPDIAPLIEQFRKEELKRDIGKAGAETLSIVLYKGPVTRTDIDYIRGVNSSFILRNLMMRGLVVRTSNPKDARTFVYDVTPELLQELGVTSRDRLPQYSDIMEKLDLFVKERTEEQVQSAGNTATTYGS
jgi:segregation and condensation protein B